MQFQSAYKDYWKTVKLYVDALAIGYFCFQRCYQMLLPFFLLRVVQMGIYRRFKIKLMQWLIPVADPGFPRRGGANSPGGGLGVAPTYDFAKISQKLHEIEIIWTPGGRIPHAPA